MAMTMPESLESRGICGVCALRDECDLENGSETPLMDCEKFAPDPSLVREVVTLALVNQVEEVPHARPNRQLGLCVNCVHSEDCTFRGNEGGVWHCEEYA